MFHSSAGPLYRLSGGGGGEHLLVISVRSREMPPGVYMPNYTATRKYRRAITYLPVHNT